MKRLCRPSHKTIQTGYVMGLIISATVSLLLQMSHPALMTSIPTWKMIISVWLLPQVLCHGIMFVLWQMSGKDRACVPVVTHCEVSIIILDNLIAERDHYQTTLAFIAQRPGSGGLTLPSPILAEAALIKFGK